MLGLQVLIVHVGAQQQEKTVGASGEHDLTFSMSALQIADDGTVPDDCTAIIGLDDFGFVFQHSGNPETERALECWEERSEKSKVVFFTGGGDLPERYEDAGIPCIPHMDSTDSLLDLQWDNVPSDFEGTADELVELLNPQPVEVLSALSILCQGYLAVHAEEHGDESKVRKALNQMGWTKDLTARTANGQTETVNDLDWWRSSFENTNNPVERAKDEWGGEASWQNSEAKEMLDKITAQDQDSLEDGDRQTVADAYCELDDRLRGKS